MLSAKLKQELEDSGYESIREMPDGSVCALFRFNFTTGLLYGLDEWAYDGRYCYERREDAAAALAAWDGTGDPPGPWIKHKGKTGERSKEL